MCIQNIKSTFLNQSAGAHHTQTSAQFSVLPVSLLPESGYGAYVITFFQPRMIRDLNFNSEKSHIREHVWLSRDNKRTQQTNVPPVWT